MIAIERLCDKLQEIYGNDYVILPYHQFLTDYTTAKRTLVNGVEDNVLGYTNEYDKLRKEKIVGVVALNNPSRVNADYYYVSSQYTITFSVPMNNIKRNTFNQIVEKPKFDFFGDYEKMSKEIINQTLRFKNDFSFETDMNGIEIDESVFASKVKYSGEYKFTSYQINPFMPITWYLNGEQVNLADYGITFTIQYISGEHHINVDFTKYVGKMVISEPIYANQNENDGENIYAIFTITGTFSMGDCSKFGSDYKVYFYTGSEYTLLDGVNSFVEIMDNDGSAIVYENTTKSGQNVGQSGWVATLSIDDIESTNLARKKLYEYIHLNKEFVDGKRKLRTKIITPDGDMHLFNAIVSITFRTTSNNVGGYDISLTDDNRPNKDRIQYTLSFNTNGGSSVESKVVDEYTKIGTLPTPTKAGYVFSKWQIDNVDIDADTIWIYESDKTAVAIYIEE